MPDWRVHFAFEVGVGPNAFGIKEGDIGVIVTETKSNDHGRVYFPVVSPYRLALSISIRAAREAQELKKRVKFKPVPGSKTKSWDEATLPALYDYFEQCMIAATFSFQALETYSNEVIEEQLDGGRTLTLERKNGPEAMDAATLQRALRTEEKLATALPFLANKPFPKSGKLWQKFTILRRTRDSIIHLKRKDHWVRGSEVDRESVFYRLLNNHPKSYTRTALGVMEHFGSGPEQIWLRHARENLEEPSGNAAAG